MAVAASVLDTGEPYRDNKPWAPRALSHRCPPWPSRLPRTQTLLQARPRWGPTPLEKGRSYTGRGVGGGRSRITFVTGDTRGVPACHVPWSRARSARPPGWCRFHHRWAADGAVLHQQKGEPPRGTSSPSGAERSLPQPTATAARPDAASQGQQGYPDPVPASRGRYRPECSATCAATRAERGCSSFTEGWSRIAKTSHGFAPESPLNQDAFFQGQCPGKFPFPR